MSIWPSCEKISVKIYPKFEQKRRPEVVFEVSEYKNIVKFWRGKYILRQNYGFVGLKLGLTLPNHSGYKLILSKLLFNLKNFFTGILGLNFLILKKFALFPLLLAGFYLFSANQDSNKIILVPKWIFFTCKF